MQLLLKNPFWFVIAVTSALFIIAVGFIATVIKSRRKLLQIQQAHVAELEDRERKLSNLFENSVVGMVRFSLHDWKVLEMNEAFRRVAAKIPLEVGENFIACFSPADQSKLKAALHDKGIVEYPETSMYCSDGSLLWVSVAVRAYFKDGYVEGIVFDYTARMKTEERLREQAVLLEKANDAIVELSTDNVVKFWNTGAEKLFLWSASEAIGKTITDLIYSKEEIPALKKRREELLDLGEWSGEVSQIRKDGNQVISSSRWTLLRGPDGVPRSILEIHTDITEKKTLEAKFLRIQKLESLGMLAGGIAHNLNNILAPIILSIQSLKKKWDDVESLNHLASLEASAHRGADLVRQILTFARGIEGKRITIRLEALIGDVLETASQTFPKSVKLERAVAADLWPAIGDVTQLTQVLMSLCVNAKDAMPHGGTLSVTAENVVVDEQFVRKNPEARTGVYVVIHVTDTGKGIPTTELDKIFEPFYTTKSLGHGTGLGLSTALGIIKSHQGFILVESLAGSGTTFKIHVPAQLYQSSEVIVTASS